MARIRVPPDATEDELRFAEQLRARLREGHRRAASYFLVRELETTLHEAGEIDLAGGDYVAELDVGPDGALLPIVVGSHR